MLLVCWGASCLCQETHLSTLHLTSLQLLQLTFQELQAYQLVLKFTLQWNHYIGLSLKPRTETYVSVTMMVRAS